MDSETAMSNLVDTFELARTGRSLSGQLAVERLERLGSLLAERDATIEWRLRGWRQPRADGFDDFMTLSFTASLLPPCVRCLKPVRVELEVVRTYRLVATEDEAQRLDLEVDEYDVLAGDTRFDLDALIEDEAIMEMPPAPRHETCEAAVPGSDDGESRQRPFASLARPGGGRKPDGGGSGGDGGGRSGDESGGESGR